jgi:hypothetical protein
MLEGDLLHLVIATAISFGNEIAEITQWIS